MSNKRDQYKLSQLGVSMIELAMVVVVASLLIGSFMTYKSFMHASQLRSVITEVARIRSGISEFRDKYFAYPGDMTLAFSYWNTACGTDASTVAGGCNGNGDTFITWASLEGVKAWQHMYLAGILQRPYDGSCTLPVNGRCDGVLDQNIPKSSYTGGGFYLENSNLTNMENVIGFAREGQFGNVSSTAENILTTDDAYAIDSKLDDGLPRLGFVKAFYPSVDNSAGNTSCVKLSGVSGSPDTYDMDNTAPDACQIHFKVSGF